MLMSIGKAPLDTLDTSIATVSFAQLTLHNCLREVLKKGWDFNTDYDMPLTPVAGEIGVDEDVLSIRPSDRALEYTQRFNPDFGEAGQMGIYDRSKRAFDEFGTAPIEFDVIWMQEFGHIPEAARAYIGHLAGRVFQAQHIGSEIIYRFTKEREIETLADFQRDHTNTKRANFFTSPTAASRIATRQPGAHRRW